jgi:glutamate dehydrogenase (NADP+)
LLIYVPHIWINNYLKHSLNIFTIYKLNQLKKQLCNENPDNNEFYQAVEEVFESLRPVLTAEHEKMKVLERFTIPEQSHKFKILWEDDKGEV